MIALDTDILARLVTHDDPEQTQAAVDLLEGASLWVAKTTLFELEWVLRTSYELDRAKIAEVLGKLLGLRQLRVEDRAAVLRAKSWYEQGMEFADALHLASSPGVEHLVTFDDRFASAAERIADAGRVVVVAGRRQV